MPPMRTAIITVVLIVFFTASGCGCGGASGYVVEVTDDTFGSQVLQASGPVLVMFYLPWCPHCQKMQQPVEDLAKDMAAELRVAKLDADRYYRTARKYVSDGYPTFVMFKSGENAASIVGEMSGTSLYEWTRNALASAN